jgi:MFS family permease
MGGSNTWISFTSTALANFAAQYNFQSIAICLLVISVNECTTNDGNCRTGDQLAWVDGTSQATIYIGAVVGQLGMGFLGDFLSRNPALTVTLATAAISAFLSAIAPDGDATAVYATIIVFRFFLGIGKKKRDDGRCLIYIIPLKLHSVCLWYHKKSKHKN